ncbi:hypothetical protein NP233_g6345 [Leucocoprinus birnbaumii]|uniref:Protein kinase domain-containing protein n=1 Tax=Leucocoprinus birnbaumii TaxID=56174 RepID=A0AAD5VSE1_9AGAR|nr:hypothetical protein NP233_g6345 [Leucocoprinus birnbaumii]
MRPRGRPSSDRFPSGSLTTNDNANTIRSHHQLVGPLQVERITLLPCIHRATLAFGFPTRSDVSTRSPHVSEQVCSNILSQVAGSEELRKTFIGNLSATERRVEVQAISDCLWNLLHAQETRQGIGRTKLLRLSYQLAKETQIFPRHLLLRDIKVASQPFAGGGFADVYEGNHKGAKVCVKVLRVFDKSDQAKFIRGYTREITLWSYMSHENILPLIGLFTAEHAARRLCLVSPLMKNGNLRCFLQNHPDTSRLPLVLDITEGLTYLHLLKIIHGDLKAQNVLISDTGRALLTDFGLSYVVLTSAVHGSSGFMAAGTTRWMAPELFSECTAPSKESDIWAFGCLCFEIYTGQYPFYQHKSSGAVVAALLRNEIPRLPTGNDIRVPPGVLDDWMWDLINSRCWCQNPKERHSAQMIRDAVATRLVHGGLPGVFTRNNSRAPELPEAQGCLLHELDYEYIAHVLIQSAESLK